MRELLSSLLPPVSYAPSQPRLAAELAAEGQSLETVHRCGQAVAGAVTPWYASHYLADWERVLGLTPGSGNTWQQRLSRVIAKIAETGGLSIPYFIRLAAGMGYTITISEPQPFRAGVSRAGERIYIKEIIWCWTVNIHARHLDVWRFRAGRSVAGERLAVWSDPVIEELFMRLKPAHTFVSFTWHADEVTEL